MSSLLKLEDGTEFDIRTAASGRVVVVGFETADLEKLLALAPRSEVEFCHRPTTYGDVKMRMGEFVAYIPNESYYLRVANHS